MKLPLLLITATVCCTAAFSQTKSTSEALRVYRAGMYDRAIPLLQRARAEEKSPAYTAQILFALARSMEENSEFENALEQYVRAEAAGYGSEATLRKALMYKTLGRYGEARGALGEYMELSPGNPEAQSALRGVELAEKQSGRKPSYMVRAVDDINSTERDYAPAMIPGEDAAGAILFTSTRRVTGGAAQDFRSGEAASAIFTAAPERKGEGRLAAKLKWSLPTAVTVGSQTSDHKGAPSLSRDGRTMYFTSCFQMTPQAMSCAILRSEKNADGSWGEPETVVRADSGRVVGHPSLSGDGRRLFFASDMHGRSDKDIYYVEMGADSVTWSAPRPVPGAVNSPADEMYPFAGTEGRLYFSSQGHGSMGGMDIFYSELQGGTYGTPVNMGVPVNSPADDFSIVMSEDGALGYFSSNRAGGRGKDDIYQVREIPLLYALEGAVADNKTGLPVDDAAVRLEGSDGSVNTVRSDARGAFRVSPELLSGNTTYKVNVEKRRYLVASVSFSTFGAGEDDFELTDEGFLNTTSLVVELDPISKPIVLPRIEYDFDRATLRPEGKAALSELVEVLEENPAIVIELRSHTDHKGSREYNEELSQKRAESCVSFLISKGVDPSRLRARGMGKEEPFIIPVNFKSSFAPGTVLTQSYIEGLKDAALDEEARQYNRRTDFRVLGEMVREDPSEYAVRGASQVAAGAETAGGVHLPADTLLPQAVFVLDTLPAEKSDMEKISEGQETERRQVLFYTLKQGDNYGTVSAAFGVTVEQLRVINGGLRGISPFEGMVLKVSLTGDYGGFDSTHYRLLRTDNTMEKVLASTGLSPEEFARLNPGFSEKDIRAGALVKTGKSAATNL